MKKLAREILTSPWLLHSICCAAALLGCASILWPLHASPEVQETAESYAGMLVLGSFIASLLLMLFATAYFFLKMSNLRAICQAIAWTAQWGVAVFLFVLLAIYADVPPPAATEDPQPIQVTDALHTPAERLTSPSSLVIDISPENFPSEQVVATPNLSKLGENETDILNAYLARSPRWAFAGQDDTFYTQPGHAVLEPPSAGGIPGHVHAAFRSLTSGAQLPAGYSVIRPGSDFPKIDNEKNGPPDLALEIDARHFLLLAWRGSKQTEIAHKAINAAINAVDSRMQELAESPNEETIRRLIEGKRTAVGNKPELRVCEPPSQYGIYQAEIFANPGRPGKLSLLIRDLDSREILRSFSFPARFSGNANELFRYDIPGGAIGEGKNDAAQFPAGAPFFAIKQGPAHQYFGVAFEVIFQPEGSHETEKLLRRCYKVQAYEKPAEPSEAMQGDPGSRPFADEQKEPGH